MLTLSLSHNLVLLCLIVLISSSCLSLIKALDSKIEHEHEYEYDRINNLPGQPSKPYISQFSGYITVHQDHGRALFYWFFESQSQPSTKPLVLWLNGGPGCSSIGYGAAVELGPLRVAPNAGGLNFNQYAWNQEANLLFVESPVGVGFSYTNTSSDLSKLDDAFAAEDAYSFLVNWLERFPHYKSRDFFLAGESYAGHYIPQLAELIYDRNKDKTKYNFINLKGFIVGNPETNDYYDYKGLLEYAWSHAVISDGLFNKAKEICDFRKPNWSSSCIECMEIVFAKYREIDIYNIYAPKCITNSSMDMDMHNIYMDGSSRSRRIFGGYDPCYSTYVQQYFNKYQVQKSFHAIGISNRGLKNTTTSLKWQVCNDSILRTYNYTTFSILPIYSKLIKGGLRIWIYSGDADGRVPVIGSRYCIEALQLTLKSSWRSWFHHHQVGGRVVEYQGLTFVTIRGAGHLVPLNKPTQALLLFRSFLAARSLPTTNSHA